MSIGKLLAAGVVAVTCASAPSQAASALLQAVPGLAMAADSATDATQVHYRGRGGGWGRGVGIGLGLGILGGIVAAEAYRPRPGYYYDDYEQEGPYYYPSGYDGDPRVVCAQKFRSFEWRTGLYSTNSGEKRLCPYLR